jgi:hypothetical protein
MDQYFFILTSPLRFALELRVAVLPSPERAIELAEHVSCDLSITPHMSQSAWTVAVRDRQRRLLSSLLVPQSLSLHEPAMADHDGLAGQGIRGERGEE